MTAPHGRASHDWPRRVAVEIVEKQWGRGILITRVPDINTHFPKWRTIDHRVGHNQEDVPREVMDQPDGTGVYATIDRDEIDPDWPVFSNWEWPGKTERGNLAQAIDDARTARTALRQALTAVAPELPLIRNPARGQLMRRLREVDMTLQEIADLFGITREAVRQTVYRAGARPEDTHG